jgi:hypothetical protein
VTISYSPIRHLLSALLLNHDPKSTRLAVYVSYYDTAGNRRDRKALFVSGLVSTEDKWLAFERAWKRGLRDEGIYAPFHMAPFMYGHAPFRAWKDNDEKRIVTVSRLLRIVKDHVHKSVSSGVIVSVFDSVKPEYDLDSARLTPFSLCATESMVKVERWRSRTRRGGAKLQHVFEKGDHDWETLNPRLVAINGPHAVDRPALSDNDDQFGFVPFQACDLLGWLHASSLTSVLDGNLSPRMKDAFVQAETIIPNDWRYFNTPASIRANCDGDGIRRRA